MSVLLGGCIFFWMGFDDFPALVLPDVLLGSIGIGIELLLMLPFCCCLLLDGVVRALLVGGMWCWSCWWGHACRFCLSLSLLDLWLWRDLGPDALVRKPVAPLGNVLMRQHRQRR